MNGTKVELNHIILQQLVLKYCSHAKRRAKSSKTYFITSGPPSLPDFLLIGPLMLLFLGLFVVLPSLSVQLLRRIPM